VLGYVSHADCRFHEAGALHPDTPERLDAIGNQLIASGLDFVIRHYDAPLATREELCRVHDPDYVERVFEMAPTEGSVEIDGDTVMSPGSLQAALRSAGAGVLAVDLVMRGEANPVFCAIRPPGHHAERDRAMGFCLFDNIAVAAAHALDHHGLNRVAIIDFDAHHGNGTEHIFGQDERVLFCSSFQHPFYPFTGHASDARNLVAVPLAANATGKEFRAAVLEYWVPALRRFKPEMMFISAGFDAHVLDDMSDLQLVDADYEWVTKEITAIATEFSQHRVVSMLEGGYVPQVLARSVVQHINALLG